MNLKELITRNYNATVRRGQISNKSTVTDFLNKIDEEVAELKDSRKTCSNIYPFDPLEAIDIILVNTTMLHHYGFDVESLLTKKVEINETRKD